MNKKQIAVIIGALAVITFSLIFPPKALIRNKKVIMRVMPFQTKKIYGRGILIETSYRDPALKYDWQRLMPFIGVVVLASGVLAYVLRDS